ncbi:type II secretion system F family protein [Ornithinimicrobium murale]|uniref:type II secretion system F family protein n=1 Tax=Ornithinimicrobium murale TaxID=1050153 RepID=UPI001EE0CB3F|nr:type II secretion system F family protein [Ornithinimicrobium murale]
MSQVAAAALCGALIVTGVIGIIVGMRPADPGPARPRRAKPSGSVLARTSSRIKLIGLVGGVIGAVIAFTTGWVIAVAAVPAIAVVVTHLLTPPAAGKVIAKLDGMAEWTRSLAGVLTAGVGLEQAIHLTAVNAPAAIRAPVSQLSARLRSGWHTEPALRLLADDLDDVTGDRIAASLLLAADRRSGGLRDVLDNLAEAVALEVSARQDIETERRKPRRTSRQVTVITAGFLTFLAFRGDYVEPYTNTLLGQMLAGVLIAAYLGLLLWLRQIAVEKPLPRFVGPSVAAKYRSESAGARGLVS